VRQKSWRIGVKNGFLLVIDLNIKHNGLGRGRVLIQYENLKIKKDKWILFLGTPLLAGAGNIFCISEEEW
jgi:hypothetical protein